MSGSMPPALDLCRGLLAYSAPGVPVAVPHAALAELVAMASAGTTAPKAAEEPLQRLHDVAALGLRYNRAPATVRQWFHDGLFGPPQARRFRGRGYVASDDAVRDFEARTGLGPVRVESGIPDSMNKAADPAETGTQTPGSAESAKGAATSRTLKRSSAAREADERQQSTKRIEHRTHKAAPARGRIGDQIRAIGTKQHSP